MGKPDFHTWNPVTGCSVVSPGCTNCYAMRLAGTRLQHEPSRSGLTQPSKAGPVWTGEVRFNAHWLDQPLRWRRPRRIFVCAHGDLFHEAVPDEWIDRVFAVMALAPQHTFLVLTKRAQRMREYMANTEREALWMNVVAALLEAVDSIAGASRRPIPILLQREPWVPLPNVWLGVSAEDQARADERIPELLATPAAKRFISAEPLLGPVDLTRIVPPRFRQTDENDPYFAYDAVRGHAIGPDDIGLPRLDWVIVGGESGAGARPMHPDWARSIRDQCVAAGVPYFFKQWGEFAPEGLSSEAWLVRPDGSFTPDPRPAGIGRHSKDGFWGAYKVGKKAAGRLLDGREWNEVPG